MQKTGKVLVVDDYEPNLRGLGQLQIGRAHV